jgi:hypothetical protein
MGLKIAADPTFDRKVGIPLKDGTRTLDVTFTFRHRTKDELDAFLKDKASMSNVDAVLAMVVGWEFDDEFNRENVERLLQMHIGAVQAIPTAYVAGLYGVRLGN